MELTKIDVYLKHVKTRLGISTTLKDEDLTLMINGVADDMVSRYGITINEEDFGIMNVIIDLSVFRYDQNNDGVPRHLDLRIKDLIYGT